MFHRIQDEFLRHGDGVPQSHRSIDAFSECFSRDRGTTHSGFRFRAKKNMRHVSESTPDVHAPESEGRFQNRGSLHMAAIRFTASFVNSGATAPCQASHGTRQSYSGNRQSNPHFLNHSSHWSSFFSDGTIPLKSRCAHACFSPL